MRGGKPEKYLNHGKEALARTANVDLNRRQWKPGLSVWPWKGWEVSIKDAELCCVGYFDGQVTNPGSRKHFCPLHSCGCNARTRARAGRARLRIKPHLKHLHLVVAPAAPTPCRRAGQHGREVPEGNHAPGLHLQRGRGHRIEHVPASPPAVHTNFISTMSQS